MRGEWQLRDWEKEKWIWKVRKDLNWSLNNPGMDLNYTREDITPYQLIAVLEELGWYEVGREHYREWCYIQFFSEEVPNKLIISLNIIDFTFHWYISEEEE